MSRCSEAAFDRRQLSIMLETIRQFRDGEINIAQLINNLESLLDVLRDIPDPWRNAFRSKWAVLEQIYAVALDEGVRFLDAKRSQEVEVALEDISAMVRAALNAISPENDV